MSATTQRGLAALGAALGLGLLGNWLFRAPDLGLNGLIWIAMLAATYLIFIRRLDQVGEGRWMLLPAVLFAAGLAWRDSPVLHMLDLLAVALSLGLTSLYIKGGDLRRSGIVTYLLGVIRTGFLAAFSLFPFIAQEIKWSELPRSNSSGKVSAIGRGLLFAIPLLLLFGALFSSADAVFANLLGNLFTFSLRDIWSHLLVTAWWSWVAASIICWAFNKAAEQELVPLSGPSISMGAIEMGMILALLNALFLAFVLVQFRYFFGGAALVEATTGLTYAEYARRGFFELVWVSALLLPILLVLHWLLPAGRQGQERLFRWLAGTLVGLLFVIMGSAVKRMLLYQSEFGLTELRLYTTAFMGWLFLLFVTFLLTVLRGQRERFAFAGVMTGFAVLAALHLINPDALIVQTNVAHAAATGRPFDGAYARALSLDAVPALVAALPELGPEERAEVAEALTEQWDRLGRADWRAWNWGRMQAYQALQGHTGTR